VLALSPGVCEELFFRGPLLSGLRRDLGPVRALVWQAVLFGAAHASLHRFLPTAGVGLLLGALTLRSRSLVPAVLLHVGYDGFQVLAATVPWTGDPSLTWLALPGAWLLVRSPAPARPAGAALVSAA
jgi:membrane protease YdiL (CAAX protease family)